MAERQPRRLNREALWEYALRALGARAHSVSELRQKLLRRAAEEDDVAGILARLKEFGYLNDQAFAEGFSASRLKNEGFGKARVLSDLRKRRVAPGLAAEAVKDTYSGTDEVQLIENYLRRKYRGADLRRNLEEPKRVAAVYRRLRQAGFGSGNILHVLKRIGSAAEALDALENVDEDAPEPES